MGVVDEPARPTEPLHRASDIELGFNQAAQNDLPTRPQAQKSPEAYPLGYVEDGFEPRTKLEIVFSSLSACQKYHARPPMTNLGFPGTKWMSVTPVASFRRRDSKAKTACSHFVSKRF